MSNTPSVKCGDRVRFKRTAIRREVGIVEEINDHVIYGEEGEVCIRGFTGARHHLPRDAVVENLDADATEVTDA